MTWKKYAIGQPAMPLNFARGWSLPIGKTEIVHVGGVRQLLAVSVHLVVKCDSPPACGNLERRIGFVYVGGLAVESDRLIQKRIARSPLHLDRNVVPGVVQEVVWLRMQFGNQFTEVGRE